jgi:hypothetical protein
MGTLKSNVRNLTDTTQACVMSQESAAPHRTVNTSQSLAADAFSSRVPDWLQRALPVQSTAENARLPPIGLCRDLAE